LGIQLLDKDQVAQLKIIQENHHDVKSRCRELLSYWLQTHPDATWYQLIEALRAPGVEMNSIAKELEDRFNGL